jgi:hypothetical protein
MSLRKIVGTTDKPTLVAVRQIEDGRQFWFETYGVAWVNQAVMQVLSVTDDPNAMPGVQGRVPWLFAPSTT